MREDAFEYHHRVCDEFVKAVFDNQDARDEAVNVLLSCNNLENQGYTRIFLKNEAKEYIEGRMKPTLEFNKLPASEQAKIYSTKDTRIEPAPPRHHRMKPQINNEDLIRAIEQDDVNAFDTMIRRAAGWRHDSVPNTKDKGLSIIGDHSKFRATNMFPPRDGDVSYGEIPVFQKLTRYLYKDGMSNAKRLNDAMVKLSKSMSPELKQQHIFSTWNGNNVNMMKLFERGRNDFKEYYKERYDVNDLPSNIAQQLDLHFMRVKNWENEGLPRDVVMDNLFDDNGQPIRSSKDDSPVGKLRKLADKYNSRSQKPLKGQLNFGRVGIDPYRLGIAMLPYDDIYQIQKWMLTGAGVQDDGSINDSVINKILGPNARGYMAHHAYLMDNMLNTIYAGGADKRGMSQTIGNRYLKDKKSRLMTEIEQEKERKIEQMKENNFPRAVESSIVSVLDNYDLESIAEKFAEENNMFFINEGGKYPHIKSDLVGSMLEMNNDLPDMKELAKSGFFDEGQLDEIINGIANDYARTEFSKHLRESINGYIYTHGCDDDWDMQKKPKLSLSPLGIVMEGVGYHGNLDGESNDFARAYEEAFEDIYFAPLSTVNFAQTNRSERTGKGSNVTQERINEFDPDKDIDGQIRVDLSTALQASNYSPEEQDAMLASYDAGNKVKLEMTRGDMSLDEIAERSLGFDPNNQDDEEEQKTGVDAIESFMEGMPSPRTPATRGLNSFYMAHSSNLQWNMDDLVGWTSLDNIPLDATSVALDTPMFGLRKKRINSFDKGADQLLHTRWLTDNENDDRLLTHHRYDLTQQDKLLIDALMMGAHDPLHIEDSESMKRFLEAIDPANKDRLSSVSHNNHNDLIGYGGRSGRDLREEVLSGATQTPDTKYAIYDAQDYEEYKRNFHDFLKKDIPYSPPVALVGQENGIATRGRLLQELKNKDQAFQEATTAREKGLREDELRKLLGMDGGQQAEHGKVVAYHKYEDEDGTTQVQPLVIAPSPSYISSLDEAHLSQMVMMAKGSGDDIQQEMLEKKLMGLREVHEGGPMSLNYHEKRLNNVADTHNAVKKVFDALRPVIEKVYPGVFEGDNAWDATAYTARMAEYISALSPRQRGLLFSGKENIRIGGKRLSFDLDNEQVQDLMHLKTQRKTHQQNTSVAREMKHSHFGGVQPKGHAMLSKLAESNEYMTSEDRRIFDEVISNVKEAASEQGISFEDAFAARYYPHSAVDRKPIKDRKASHDMIRLRHRQGNFMHNDGGTYHDGREFGLLHGGPSVTTKKGKPISMGKEREIIFQMLKHGLEETRMGSDVSLQNAPLWNKSVLRKNMTAKQSMNFNKPNQWKKIGLTLASPTTTAMKTKLGGEDEDKSMGGMDFNNAQPMPLYTSRDKKFHYGTVIKPPFVINTEALADGNLYLEDDDAHTYNTPPKAMKAYMPRNAMIHLNPNLKPLDATNPNNTVQYTNFESEPNPNMRIGQSANQAMGAAQEGGVNVNDESLFHYSDIDLALDDTLIMKDDGKPQPVKFMHRIFDLEDMQHLRGFTGDWVISLYPQGEHVIATKKGKKLSAYSTEGEVKLDDDILAEVEKVYEKDFTVHAILHDGIMTVIDLLKTADEDTHNMPTKDRIRHLRAQYESSEHIKMPEPINTKRSDDEGLKVAVDRLMSENNMDILLRDANATYMKGEPRHPKWVLLSKEKMVDVVILSRNGKNYSVGVGPLMFPENYGKRAQQVGDEHYMNVGSAKGPRGLKVGDFATIRCTGVSASKGDNPVYRVRSAKITDNEPLAADSVETLAIMSGDHHVPQQVNMKKGKITILFPAFDDEVICKTREEEGVWMVEPQSSVWGNEYLVKLAHDQEPYWELKAAWLLKEEPEDEPEYDEVDPEPPAGHSKKPKKVLDDEEEVIKRGLELVERGLEHLAKEKITSTGVQGLGLDYAGADVESPRGPTENIRDDTMPDFDPQARRDDEVKPAKGKRTKRLRSTEGETATLEDDGVIAVENSSFDIQ